MIKATLKKTRLFSYGRTPPLSPWFANSKVFASPNELTSKVSSAQYPKFRLLNIIVNLQHNIFMRLSNDSLCFETNYLAW